MFFSVMINMEEFFFAIFLTDFAKFSLAAVAFLILGGITAWLLKPSTPLASQEPAYVEINLPPGDELETANAPPIAISPDGRHLVYVAFHDGVKRLFVRSLDSGYEAKPLPGTEGAVYPFFSPDSEWIGFFAESKIKKVSLAGGTAMPICPSGDWGGAAWGPDSTIVFTPSDDSNLLRVSEDGGESEPLTTLDRTKGESSHRYPQFLPGGETLLFTTATGVGWDEFNVVALRLDTGERITVVEKGHTGRFVPTGHLVYYRAGELLAVPFDPILLQVLDSSPRTFQEGIK